ncbi:hypothetical protein ACKAMS_22810 [Rhodococcus sp. 5A-K4]|uniref:hypothetical protein n=1 Tax=Rhodococcus sp. 5A-K4 TaxID=3384442 RepID=UPI0038D473BC
MTVIMEPLTDPAGRPETDPLTFYIETIRQNASGTATVSVKRVDVTPVDGVLTTPDLDPGPTQVQWRGVRYKIDIPDSDTSVRLWPLIDAGWPTPSPGAPGFVRNAGGIDRMEPVELADYSGHPKVPASLYLLF